jgi:hypothetical protein
MANVAEGFRSATKGNRVIGFIIGAGVVQYQHISPTFSWVDALISTTGAVSLIVALWTLGYMLLTPSQSVEK